MKKNNCLDNVFIVLHEPRYSENIGAAARAACNMGIRDIRIVNPQNWDKEKAMKLATHHAMELIDEKSFYPSLKEALGDAGHIIGTTARLGKHRSEQLTPRLAAEQMIPYLKNNRVAMIFGPESRGLSNEELRLCHRIVTIPTGGDCSSLNLGQSVVILCYELFLANYNNISAFQPQVAKSVEVEAMYEHLKETLVKIDYMKADNADYWMWHIRKFFSQRPVLSRETQILRGVCRQIDWYANRRLEKIKEGLLQDINS